MKSFSKIILANKFVIRSCNFKLKILTLKNFTKSTVGGDFDLYGYIMYTTCQTTQNDDDLLAALITFISSSIVEIRNVNTQPRIIS